MKKRLLLALVLASTAHASAKEAGVHLYEGLALSSNGAQIAAVESVDPFADRAEEPHGQIVIRSVRTGQVTKIIDPGPAFRYGGLSWSPNGSLAFVVSDHKAGTAALEVMTSGRTRTCWKIKGSMQVPRWSPDGSKIAVQVVLGAHKKTGAVEAGAPQVGEIGSVPDEQRLAVLPASGGAARLVFPKDHWIYEYAWTPDGRGFVATAARGNGDNNWWLARLVAVNLTTGSLRQIATVKTQINYPCISPDGKTVAFIGGLMSDFGSVGGDIYTVPLAGGSVDDITPAYKGSFSSLRWRGKNLFGLAVLQGSNAVVEVNPESKSVKILPHEEASYSPIVLSSDGRTAATVAQTYERPARILVGPPLAMRALTRDNDRLQAQVRARSLTWKSDEFNQVQGWLLGPTKVSQGLHPLITVIHGGPASAARPNYISAAQKIFPTLNLVQRGYFVFFPNPRGSYGQGEAFASANRRDFGGGDLRDVLAGIDEVEKQAPIDNRRLGVFGHSYGGFMTMWAVTHTNRFKAAVAGAGISNWISYYGENGINEWMPPFFGSSAYDDPEIYQKLSPLSAIKSAHTPTLVYVGERDVECPAAQSLEFWRGLRAMGVPSTLVIYPGQGHAIRSPKHLQDLRRRQLAWFAKYLK